VAGRVAIGFIVSTQLPGFQGAMTDELGLALMPGVASGTQPLWPQLSQVMTISRGSSNPEAAARVINFMINSPDAGRILHSDRGASASSTFRAGEVVTPLQQRINRYHDIAGPFISPEGAHLPNDTEFNSVAFLIHQQVAFGQLTPAQGGQQLFELITRLAGS
jgi:multiple sugar transport system substrate-binding protein